jgi:hypothetical protein
VPRLRGLRATGSGLEREQLDHRGDVACGDRIGAHVDGRWQEAHERFGDVEVVVVARADERRHRARPADLELAGRGHEPLLDGAVESDASAGRL